MPDVARLADLDEGTWRLVAQAVERLESEWRKSPPPPRLGEFLPEAGHPLRERVLVELIMVDQEFRWKSESERRKRTEDYLADWPELANRSEFVSELVTGECLTRAVFDTPVSLEELESRFPLVCQNIDLQQIYEDAQTEKAPAAPKTPSMETSTNGAGNTQPSTAAPCLLKPGDHFGRYAIRTLLGQGGMGTVFRAYDAKLDRDVAIKVPFFDTEAKAVLSERFLREARAAAKIRHPNICPIYDVGDVDGTCYLAMALIEGQSLDECMKLRRLEPLEFAELVCKIASALEQVHSKGIVHRDVKPSNVMIDDTGEPLLLDFGLARQVKITGDWDAQPSPAAPTVQEGNLTRDGVLVGTPAYLSPEQAQCQPADARSDVYALGVLLYEGLSGELPFKGNLKELLAAKLESEPVKLRTLRPDVPEPLEAICLKAMAKNRADRYESAGCLSQALQQFIRRSPKPLLVRPWFRRLVAMTGMAAVMLASVFIYLKTGKAELTVTVNEANAKVRLNGILIELNAARQTIAVPLGAHVLEVETEGFAKFREPVTIRWRGEQIEISVRLKPLSTSVIPIQRWIETGQSVEDICISTGGSSLYTAHPLRGDQTPVGQFSTGTDGRLKSIHFGSGYTTDVRMDHKGLAISPDERFLFTTNYYGRFISRVDLQKENSRTDLDVTTDPSVGNAWTAQLGISPDGKKLVVPWGMDGRDKDDNNDHVSVIDISDGQFRLAGEVPLRDEPVGTSVSFSADGKFAYLATRQRKSNAAQLYEIGLVPPFAVTRGLAFPEGDLQDVVVDGLRRRALVSDAAHLRVSVVDLESFRVASQFELKGDQPDQLHRPGPMAFASGCRVLAVLAPETRTMFFVDSKDGTVLGKVTGLRYDARRVAFSPTEEQVFVAHRSDRGGIAVVGVRHLLHCITFASDRDGESYQIYRLDGEGGSIVRLTNTRATDRSPRWSPDARKIAFLSNRQGPPRIVVMNADGDEVSVLDKTTPTMDVPFEWGTSLDWSPDGSQIAFVAIGRQAICVVDVASGEVRKVTEGPVSRECSLHNGLCWRKTDGKILFSSQPPQWIHGQEIFELDPLTGKLSQITNQSGNLTFFMSPDSSADGKNLLAVRQPETEIPMREIALMDADGANVQIVASARERPHANPRWFRNGHEIIYSAQNEGFYRLYTLKLQDRLPVQLGGGAWNDIEPDVTSRH